MDSAVAYTILWRAVSSLGGVGSIFFIAKCLTSAEQGYFYTFSSLISVQFFFELGFSYVVTPFVAHENSFITWYGKSSFEGPDKNFSRMASLLRFIVKWFSILSVFAFITTAAVGYIFFSYYHKKDLHIDWLVPYLLLCFGASASLNTIPILAYFDGLGKVKEMVKVKLVQQLIYLALLYTFFISGFKLYASPLASLSGLSFVAAYILTSERLKILKAIWHRLSVWTIPYRKELFPLQWKIAVGLMSSYLMYQLFNPILFAAEGPVVAGQMGLSLASFTGLFFISFAWINTKQPLFTNLAARNNIKELDRIYKKSLLFSVATNILLVVAVICFVAICNQYHFVIGQKFLPVLPLSLLGAGMLGNCIIAGLGVYFRAYKKEPFFILSLVLAILNCVLTFVFGRVAGVMGITTSFSILTICIGVTWAIILFRKEKRAVQFSSSNNEDALQWQLEMVEEL